jgi:glucose-6-phosphate isomerase
VRDAARSWFLRLGGSTAAHGEALRRVERQDFAGRIWRKDPTLWKSDSAHRKIIESALGWLDVPETMRQRAGDILRWARGVRASGVRHVVLCGMGGSSLAPEVFAKTFQSPDWPRLLVLDSTSPEQIGETEKSIELNRTLFLICSKSGTTLETLSHFRYFHARVEEALGSAPEAGKRFAAITDPGSPLEELARSRGFGRIFSNFPDIGGRYSALSYFGLVPAALCGADIRRLLDRAVAARGACDASLSAAENAGSVLGAALGGLAARGRDKATVFCSPEIASFGTWLEQLVAESTGKEGRGIVPVEGEPPGEPGSYGEDRFFLYERLAGTADRSLDEKMDDLARAGHPVAAFSLADRYDLAARMFVWEFAVAVAGALLGIDAFDQPNVQESKDNTAQVLADFVKRGSFRPEKASWSSHGLEFFGKTLGSFLEGARRGRDYVALQAYAARGERNEETLARLRAAIRDHTRCAVTVGFGPRFLHSTGQLHKGGPDEGLFLQFVARPREDLKIPEAPYGFTTFFEAQALGDEQALKKRRRRFLKAFYEGDSAEGLDRLARVAAVALGGAE